VELQRSNWKLIYLTVNLDQTNESEASR